jgi:phosphoribosyl 1,2-cyclic phosphate phosphodiesterase
MPSLELIFLGTGTSQGIPVIGCDCPVCHSTDPRDRRTRCSLLVRSPGCHVVLDTAPEFRIQCLREGVNRLDAALMTHAHTDHMMGFDDMRRFCEMEDKPMPVYASPATMEGLRKTFRYAFDDPQPWKNYLRLAPTEVTGPFALGDMTVIPVDLPHGKTVTTGYVFHHAGKKLLAYFTDCASVPTEAASAAEGVELLVLDALRETPHPTHMTFREAIGAARSIRPARTLLVHLNHETFHAVKEAELPERFGLAHDGMRTRVGEQ